MPVKKMTSRDRVLKTINHQEPDRVPFNLSLTVDIYHRLRKYLNLPSDLDTPYGIWTNVTMPFDLIEAMNIDFYYSGLNSIHKNSKKPDNDLMYDEWGIGRKKILRSDGSFYFEMVDHPLANATLEDIQDFDWPDPNAPERIAGLRKKIQQIRKETDKAIMLKFSNSIWEQSWWLYGMEQWMSDLLLKPEITGAILDKVTSIAVRLMEIGVEELGDLVDIIRLSGEDLGSQTAPMISPKMFNSIIKPRFDKLWTTAKNKMLPKNPEGKIMLHSCGNVRPFIPTWIDMGLDILDPIQPRAIGMEPEGLAKDFGDHLVFHGGVDIQNTLPFGKPQEVITEVKKYIDILGPGGGYIIAPAHNVQSDVPPENLVAIRDAIEEYGNYPIGKNI